jgi:hypothetical protein
VYEGRDAADANRKAVLRVGRTALLVRGRGCRGYDSRSGFEVHGLAVRGYEIKPR